ncbi:MAG: septation regulator SpoVG [Oscillospiraceae bacterium]|nr:septation regulator SpoVG [Oscillospiraceae bacterium]
MEITDLKIRKMFPEGRLRAIVSITLDQMLAVHDIKVVQGENRLFVAMPSRQDEAGIFRDIVHPITASARQFFETQIVEAYQRQVALMQAEADYRSNKEPEQAPAAEAAPAEETEA